MDRDQLLRRQAPQILRRRALPTRPRLKINLYKGIETEAVADAAAALAATSGESGIDCLMVGDSYLMTHLGGSPTRIGDPVEQRRVLALLIGLMAEVRRARDACFGPSGPWLMADFPDGSAGEVESARRSTDAMAGAGAECVKLELGNEAAFAVLERLSAKGVPVAAHIGYTPQARLNRRYGVNGQEAAALFAEARRARDAGAVALVLERVTNAVHERLAAPAADALPVYAIFSGAVPGTGQSLNIWDAVVRPDFAAKAFPPTASLTRADYPAGYTRAVIARHIQELMRLTLEGEFPPPERKPLAAEDLAVLDALPVWSVPG
jgi:ketopantoate hydroxymethyltransferase